MAKLKYKMTRDTLFHVYFTKHPDLLKRLVAALLDLQYESIEQFEITNPERPPEVVGGKFCGLDISMVVNEERINLEVQVQNKGDFPERSLFYWAREYSSSISEGQSYSDLPKTIVIGILDFKLFNCREFHSEFQALEVTRHTPLTDKLSMHYFELPKFSSQIDIEDYKVLWLKFFQAKTEEEIAKIEALEVPFMKEAVKAYRSVTVSTAFKEIERMKTKARFDEAQALHNATQKGMKLGLEEGIELGIEQGLEQGLEQGRQQGAEEERQKWQELIEKINAERQEENEKMRAIIAELEKMSEKIAELEARS
jgi:predicted transposase/invertase (TIGR01784 family)